MLVRFEHQILIGFRVHAPGEVADLPVDVAERLIADGIAVAAAPEPVREAVNPVAKRARQAVKRGGPDREAGRS